MQEDFGEYQYHIDSVKMHSKKRLYHVQKAIEELIIHNYPREKISQKLKKDLDGFMSPDRIQHICAEVGATDQKKATTTGTHLEEVDFGDGTRGWRRVDGDDEEEERDPTNPVTPQAQQRPTDWHPYEEENQIYIGHIKRNIELQREIIRKLETSPFISKLDIAAMKDLNEFLYCSGQIMEQTREAWDDRQKIPMSTQIHLARICIDESNHHSAAVYIAYVKELFSISAKQIGKTLRGIIRNVDFRYEPNTEQTARDGGYYGKPCTKCSNYRVKYEHGWLHCFKCEYDEQAEPEKLPKAGVPENAVELTPEFMRKLDDCEVN